MAKGKQQVKAKYAPGYKQCPACSKFILGTRSAECPNCQHKFVTKPKADKPKATAKPKAAKPVASTGALDVKDAITFASKAGSIEAAQEQLNKLKALKALSDQVKDL